LSSITQSRSRDNHWPSSTSSIRGKRIELITAACSDTTILRLQPTVTSEYVQVTVSLLRAHGMALKRKRSKSTTPRAQPGKRALNAEESSGKAATKRQQALTTSKSATKASAEAKTLQTLPADSDSEEGIVPKSDRLRQESAVLI
jgi:hypothetical protein